MLVLEPGDKPEGRYILERGGQVGKDHMLKPAEGACLSKMSRELRKDFKHESNGLECWKKKVS